MSKLASVLKNLQSFFQTRPVSQADLHAKSILTDAQNSALVELLIQKGIITHEEYKERADKLLVEYEEQILMNRGEKLD